jgi:uncharacterized protein (DUF362 family)
MQAVSERKCVAIVRYEESGDPVKKAVELSNGLAELSTAAKVFVKPNIVFWSRTVPFPKWGVITTSRVVEGVVRILKDKGIEDITIGEGMVTFDPKDRETPAHAFETLGYRRLHEKYGVRCLNLHEGGFRRVQVDEDISLNFSTVFLDSDFVINLPVLKTHAQTVVSLGMKNLKGTLDVPSRKQCHSPLGEKDLNYIIARLPRNMPPSFTLLDGIYTNERGPGFDGKVRRSDLLVASADLISADMVGAKVLGYDPVEVPHILNSARIEKRPLDLSGISIKGERIEDVASRHQHSFTYTEDRSLPLPMKRMGIKGISYRKYDLTLCTYCSFLAGPLLSAIAAAWKGKPWDDVEVLTGKMMAPTPGKRKTILIGKCIYQAHKDNPDIQEMIAVKGCPPSVGKIVEAFHLAGIPLEPNLPQHFEDYPGLFMKKYEGKRQFDESFFRIL